MSKALRRGSRKSNPRARLSRRHFLLGAGGLGLASACSGPEPSAASPQLVNLFSPDRVLVAGRQQRVPFAVVDLGDLRVDDGREVPVTVLRDGIVVEELTVAGRVVEHDHVDPELDPDHQHADLLRYYALRASFPDPGIYDLEVDFGDGRIGRLPVQIFRPDEAGLPLPGERLPSIVTPTFDRPEGIRPLCTRSPEPCPFHSLSVDEALGRPLALLVATPALCTTAYCGPVLETLIAEAPDFAGVTAIHLEVYANAEEVDGNYADPALELARPVLELGLEFEPSLFLINSDGIVMDRIDNLFDRSELRSALGALGGV